MRLTRQIRGPNAGGGREKEREREREGERGREREREPSFMKWTKP